MDLLAPLSDEMKEKMRLGVRAPQILGPLATLTSPKTSLPQPSPVLRAAYDAGTPPSVPPPAGALPGVFSAPPPSAAPTDVRQPPPAPTPLSEFELQHPGGEPKLHGLKLGLDVLGRIFTPKIERAIPGSPGAYQAGLEQAEQQTARQQVLEQRAAQTAETQARTEREQAQATKVAETPIAAPKPTPAPKPAPTPKPTYKVDAQGNLQAITVGPDGKSREEPVLDPSGQPVKGFGKPTPAKSSGGRGPKLSEPEKKIVDWLAENNLPNTPANRNKARAALLGSEAAAKAEGSASAKQKELAQSANQALKNLRALSRQDSPASNYAFLMNFIGMSYEGVRGARLNRAEIERAALTRSLPDQLQKAYDLWMERKVLTRQQKEDMLRAAEALAGTYNETGGGGTSSPEDAPKGFKPF